MKAQSPAPAPITPKILHQVPVTMRQRRQRLTSPWTKCLLVMVSSATMLWSPFASLATVIVKEASIAVVTVPSDPNTDGSVHLTCFRRSKNHLAMDEVEIEKPECCRKLWDLRKNFCENERKFVTCRQDGQEFVSWCTTRIATVPTVSINDTVETLETDEAVPLEPILSLVIFSEQVDEYHEDSLRTGGESLGWRQYHHVDNGSEHSKNESNVRSPFSLSSEPQRDSPLLGHVASELSAEGGMHRSLAHTVTLTFADKNNDSELPIHGFIILYIFLSENVFIDMDDPLDGPCYSSVDTWLCKAELVPTKHAVIDIEQPAFASPQHVVAVRINVQGESLPTEVTVRVATKIHLRYPQLASGTSSHVSVAIPAPLLHTGSFLRGQERLGFVSTFSYGKPITFRVAAGIKEDYGWVALITILCSITGSLVMLRDITRVSKWY